MIFPEPFTVSIVSAPPKPRRIVIGARAHAELADQIRSHRGHLEIRGSPYTAVTADDLSWADTYEQALQNALTEWPNGGMPFPKADIRSPEDFAEIAKLVRPENYKNRMLISPDLDEHRANLQQFVDLGFDEIHVHNVGRNQEQFIKAFGEQVIPQLTKR